MSSKPSWRATFSKSGYMVPHSYFSPAAAARKFSMVGAMIPAGKVPVISTSPPSRNLKKRLACSFSWLAVSVKISDIWR